MRKRLRLQRLFFAGRDVDIKVFKRNPVDASVGKADLEPGEYRRDGGIGNVTNLDLQVSRRRFGITRDLNGGNERRASRLPGQRVVAFGFRVGLEDDFVLCYGEPLDSGELVFGGLFGAAFVGRDCDDKRRGDGRGEEPDEPKGASFVPPLGIGRFGDVRHCHEPCRNVAKEQHGGHKQYDDAG